MVLQGPCIEILDRLSIVGLYADIRHGSPISFEKEPTVGRIIVEPFGSERGIGAPGHSACGHIESLIDSELSKD